jgi:hypothetical protein
MIGAFRRFRGVGGLPPALRAQFEPEGILFVPERVGVRQRFSGTGPATVMLDAAGVSMHTTLARVDPRFSGETTTSWKFALTVDVLAGVPTRRLSFEVSPDYVFASLGVRAKP